jgi:hypothetical protein
MVVLMRNRLLVGLCVVALALLAAPPASAAGWWLQYSDRSSRLCLDVQGASSADGAILQQSTCKTPVGSGAANQQFQTQAVSGGYLFVALHSNKCIQIQGGSLVDGAIAQQLTCTGAANQLWQLSLVSTNPNGSSNYLIRNVNSAKCLRAAPTGSPVTQQTCNSASTQQVWHQHLREGGQ